MTMTMRLLALAAMVVGLVPALAGAAPAAKMHCEEAHAAAAAADAAADAPAARAFDETGAPHNF